MPLSDFIRKTLRNFLQEPVADQSTMDVAWSESLIYSRSGWPKYNPDQLIGRKGFNIYRQMMMDEQVKAVTRFKRDAITSRQYYFRVDGEEEDASLEERSKVFQEILRRMEGSFLDVLNGIMTSTYNGFSMTEKVFRPVEYENKIYIGLAHCRLKPYDSFYFHTDEYGNLLYVEQKWENASQIIDMARFIHHVQNPDMDVHYGQSELRDAYRAWFSKDMAVRFQNIFLERHASGFIWVTAKEGATLPRKGTAEYNDLTSVLKNMQTKTAILLSPQLELHYESPAQTDAFERAISSYDRGIAKALLVPNLLGLTEQGQTGSYAQSQTQLEAFLWTLDAESARLAETVNEQLFKPLGDLNWGDGKYPVFCFKPVSESMRLAILKAWQGLVASGAVQHTDTDEAHVREILNFPAPGEPIEKSPSALPGFPSPQDDEDPEKRNKNLPDETVVGRGQVKTSRRAFATAIKRVDFAVIDNRATQIAQAGIDRSTEPVKDLVEGIKIAIKDLGLLKKPDGIKELKPLAGAMGRLRRRALEALEEAWELGRTHAGKEILKAIKKEFQVKGNVADAAAQKFLEARSFSLAGDTFDGIRKKASTIIYNAIKGDWTLDEIYDAIDNELGSVFLPHLATAIRTIVFEAINEARYEYFTDPDVSDFVEALQYSAIIDGRTTEICQYMDGRIYRADSDVWSDYRPPNHFNCRSLLIAVTTEDKWSEDDPPEILPAEGFGG